MPSETIYGTHTIRDLNGMVLAVELSRSLKVRVWLAFVLIRFAVWMMGGRTEIEDEAEEE